MTASREELLIYGYVREYHREHNIDLPPNDLILLFVSWIKLMDSFDKALVHPDMQFDPDICTKFKRIGKSPDGYASLVGTYIIEKGMKETWTFKINPKANYPLIGIELTSSKQKFKLLETSTCYMEDYTNFYLEVYTSAQKLNLQNRSCVNICLWVVY